MGLDLYVTLQTKKDMEESQFKVYKERDEDIDINEDSVNLYYRLNWYGVRWEGETYYKMGLGFSPIGVIALNEWEGGNGEEFRIENRGENIDLYSLEYIYEDEDDEEGEYKEKLIKTITNEEKEDLQKDIEEMLKQNDLLDKDEYDYLKGKTNTILDMLLEVLKTEGTSLNVCYG